MNQPQFFSDHRWEKILTAAAPALVLGSAGLAALAGGGGQQYFSYMLAGGAALFLIGAVIGLVMVWLQRWLVVPVLLLVLVFALDIAFGWIEFVALHVRMVLLEPPLLRRSLTLILAVGAPGLLLYALRTRAVPVLVAASLAFAISSLVLPAGALPGVARLIDREKPAGPLGRVVIHLMLDAHSGPFGIPADMPGAEGMRRQISDFYVSRGFRIYGSAYSPYAMTRYSLPAFFDLDDPLPDRITVEDINRRWNKPFAWFEKLRNDGYSVYAYSIGYSLDLCSGGARSFVRCERYAGDGLDLSLWQERPWHRMLIYAGRRSALLQRMCDQSDYCYRNFNIYWVDMGRNLRSVQVMDRVEDAIGVASGDTAIFAHVLLPHSPQLLGADCKPVQPYFYDSSAETFYRRYFDQVKCTQLHVDRILRALEARGALNDATIIIHSDHGNGPLTPVNQTDRWRAPWHSALFAVRNPGVKPGLDGGFYRAQSLLSAFASGKPPLPGDGKVWDLDAGMRPSPAQIHSQALAPQTVNR